MSFNLDKTELMIFSNSEILEFNVTFNGKTIPISILTNIWELHLAVIENILSSIYKHLNVLRKLKYKLSPLTNIKKLYLVHIRLIFEYAYEVCDKCRIF
jgi:hypothetical protein